MATPKKPKGQTKIRSGIFKGMTRDELAAAKRRGRAARKRYNAANRRLAGRGRDLPNGGHFVVIGWAPRGHVGYI